MPEAETKSATRVRSLDLTPGPRRRRKALLAVCLGFFVIQLDATIVNVALPAIQRDVGGSLAGLQWVIDGYTLPLAAFMLTAGSAADRLGARRIFLAGLAVFTASSAACAAAPTLALLIAARAFQGLGAAALLPCSLALIVHQFPGRAERARALGAWGGIASVGLAAGPVLGGSLVTLVSWRLIFAVNVPACLLTAALVRRWVEESPRRAAGTTDLAGLVLGILTLGSLTAGFIKAGQRGWLSGPALGLFVIAAAGAPAFVLAERRRAAPMLPLSMFRSRAFSAATAVGVLFNLCFYGTLLCLSLFLQRSLGQSALRAGLTILPMTLAISAGSTASGRLTASFGPRLPMLSGMCCGALGVALISLTGPAGPLWPILTGSVILGFCSLAMPAMTAVCVGAAGPERAGLASGVLNAARQTGGALGVAMLGALLAASATAAGRATLAGPLRVAAAGYLLAIALSWLATARPESGSLGKHRPAGGC